MSKFALLACLALVSCAAGDIREPGVCESHGVLELGHARTVRAERGELRSAVNDACRGPLPEGYEFAGCVLENPDGTVDLIWVLGDGCAEAHERCHALHGYKHTQRYNRALVNKHPRPACPEWR